MWKTILERLYNTEQIDETRLDNAVTKGLITETEKQEVLSQS